MIVFEVGGYRIIWTYLFFTFSTLLVWQRRIWEEKLNATRRLSNRTVINDVDEFFNIITFKIFYWI